MIILRTLLDAHGPKKVSESKQYDLTTHRKFFHASPSQHLDSLTRKFSRFTSEKQQNSAKNCMSVSEGVNFKRREKISVRR